MQSIFDAITEWLKGLLVEGIMGNLGGLFTGVNEQVGEIAAQVGMTPAAWNAGVFSMIRQLSETVILPIAGLVLTFVMTYELIQMLIDHNNLHNFDTWIFFKWIFKTFVAVLILSNTFNIVMAVFDVSQQVIQQSAGLIQGSTAVTPDVLNDMQSQLEAMELGPLLGIFLQSFFVQFTMTALNIVIFVIVYGRMIEIYLMTSLAPIPFATSANREAGHMGHNYFKSLFAIGFQGMLIMVCMAIYAVLVQSIATSGDMPTLQDLYDLLCQQSELEAKRLATALEIYVSGSLNLFNHKTNVDYEAFGVTYDAEKDQWYFNGEEVRYFRDVLTSNGESLTSGKFRGEMRTLGSGVGTIDIYTVRDYGHLNSEHHGTLTGIEKYSQEEFDEHTQAGMSGNQPIGNASHN